MYRLLIVTDEETLANSLAAALAGANVVCATVATDLDSIEDAMSKGGPDAAAIDSRSRVNLKRLIPIIRTHPGLEEIPIVAVLPLDAMASLPIPALDDFVFDPVSIPELAARILTRLVKSRAAEEGTTIRVGTLEVDIDNYKAKLDDETLDMTYKEFELLRFLLTNRGRVFTREALLNRVWGYDYFGGARTVDVHIRRLRAKLGIYQSLIETVRSVGYRFSEDES